MTLPITQNSFVSGELAPSVLGRIDKAQYHNGATTMRNFFVRYTGGASSRAGLAYCLMQKQGAPNVGGSPTGNPPRIIEFQYNINQGFVLEFGDQYMRVIFQGGYITETVKNITNILQGDPATLTIIGHGYSVGDWVFVSGVQGMTQINGLTYIVNNVIDVNTITITDLFGINVNSTLFNPYISGGTSARIYTVVAPYAAIDLPYLKFTQSANVMSLCCINQQTLMEYPTYDLQRFGNTNWQFGQVTFTASIGPPSSVIASAQNSTTIDMAYAYVVTAVSASTGEESVASAIVTVNNNDISINAGSNTIRWSAVAGASQYNIYVATPAYNNSVSFVGVPFGYVGTSTSNIFTDTNIVPDFTTTPPLHNNPFAGNAIAGGQVTNQGNGTYTSSNIGYVINTTTGTGAILVPFVSDGFFVGLGVINGGQGYNPLTDTITITSGGAGPPVSASGTYTFLIDQNPLSGESIILYGQTWTFVPFSPSGNESQIGGNLSLTLANLVAALNASTDPFISLASYTLAGAVLTITYKVPGLAGNAYTLASGSYGGFVSGTTLTGGADGGAGGGAGAAATLIFGASAGNYPSVVAYYQQRRVYANTLSQPDTYFFSKPGAFENMDSAIPTIDSDAIVGTPWGQQINGIQFFQPTVNGLLTFTGNGVWNVSGGNSVAITPSDQNAQAQAQVGCSAVVPPLYINLHVLYVQSKNSIVRDVAYNFIYNVFQGTDITFWSTHLFQNYSILQWAYAEEPFKMVWSVRNDGVLLSLTYVKEQEIEGWARHDTNGLFVSTCTVTEKHQADIHDPTQFGPLVDAPYFSVQRYITGHDEWVYYLERMDDRNWFTVEDCVCVDAALQWPMSYPQAVLSPAAANGTQNITSTLVINGGMNYTAPIGVAVDATGSGTGATFSFTVVGGVITACTPLTGGTLYTAGETTIVVTDSTGSEAIIQPVITNYVTFNASASVFNSSMIGDVIRADNGKATIIATAGTSCIANVTQPLTITVPNDPNNLPVPVVAGEWSVSTPTSVVTGLNHLEGMTVTGLADGGVIPPVEVVNGSISLGQPASVIVVGLPYTCQLQTPYLEVPSQTTTQGKRKNVSSAIIRVEASRGLQIGANQSDSSLAPDQAVVPWTNLDEWKQRNMFINAGSAVPLFSGNSEPINITDSWDQKGQIAIQQSYPLPANVLSVFGQAALGDPNG